MFGSLSIEHLSVPNNTHNHNTQVKYIGIIPPKYPKWAERVGKIKYKG